MELISRAFSLWCQINWLREIDKAQRKLERLQDEAKRQRYVVARLKAKYLELYPEGINDD